MQTHLPNITQKLMVWRIFSTITLSLLVLGLFLWGQALPQVVHAATLIVNNTGDSGAGTLRMAIADAAHGDTIAFDSSLSGQTITLSNPLVINKALTIDGSSLSTMITISGNDAVRVFHIYTDTHVILDSLTIAYGAATIWEYGAPPVGGGVKIEPGAAVTLTHSAVLSNIATYYDEDWEEYYGHGGGIYNLGSLTVLDTAFSDNVASGRTGYVSGDGGAIFNRGKLAVTGSTFIGNAAEAGGAIYNQSGMTLTVESSTISGNVSPCGGAGIGNRGIATVSNSTIADNLAPGDWCEGGAAGISNSGGAMTVTHSIISGNVSEGYYGGLSNYNGSLTVLDSAIYSNTANNHGGGIYNWWGAALSVINSEIYSNTAGWWGGGIFSGPDGGASLSLVNSTIYDNSAQNGGGIYNGSPFNDSGAVLTVINSTVVSNTATGSGGGLYNKDAAPTLVNSILWDNAATSGAQIHLQNNTTILSPIISTSDIEGSGGSGVGWNTSLGDDGGGNIDADPLFVASNQDNLRLNFASPAMDTGSNSDCPSTDKDGLPRPNDGNGDGSATCDMGAYEAGQMLCTAPYNFANQSGVSVQITTAGSLACIYVDEMEINHSNATSGLQTGRYWLMRGLENDRITNASGYVVTLSLPHGVTDPNVCKHLNGTVWDCGRTDWDTSTVTRSGISTFSDWAVGDHVGPTAIGLSDFSIISRVITPALWLTSLLLVFAVALVLRLKRKARI